MAEPRTRTVAAIIDISIADLNSAPSGMRFDIEATGETTPDGLSYYTAANGFKASLPDSAEVGMVVPAVSWPGHDTEIAGRRFVVID